MNIYQRESKPPTNLLPDDAYPRDPATGAPMPAEKRAKVDRRLHELQHTVPTEPGEYLDGKGDRWILDAEGG